MNKGTLFIGQPMYGQLSNLLDKSKILRFSRENGGERFVSYLAYPITDSSLCICVR